MREGFSLLTVQYENERSQTETNIKEQLRALSDSKALSEDIPAIEKSIKQLKSSKKIIKSKLSYLDPRKQIARLFIPLVIAFASVLVSIVFEGYIGYVLLILSIAGVAYAVYVYWNLLRMIIEVRKASTSKAQGSEAVSVDLLHSLVKEIRDATGEYFLKDVYIKVNQKTIEDSGIVTMKVNEQTELLISIENNEKRMAKKVEIGFIFPSNFIIEERSNYTVFRTEDEQIVRFSVDALHGKTYLNFNPSLSLKALQRGKYKIKTFVKAENIESTYKNLNIEIT
jgi:hypothetical protein